MWASLGDWSLPLKRGGGSWQDKVFFFLLDLKDSLLLRGVLLQSGMGEDSLFSPSMSSWLTGGPGVFLCLFGFFGDFWYMFLFISCPVLYARPSI